jgi:hypothetical protein
MLLTLFICVVLSQRFLIKYYPEWLRIRMRKMIEIWSLYFIRLKNRGQVLLHSRSLSPGRSATETRTTVNYTSKNL